MRIKNNLDYIMWMRRIPAYKLAEASGVTDVLISKVRHNPHHNITINSAAKLCTALKIRLDELLIIEEEDEPDPADAKTPQP